MDPTPAPEAPQPPTIEERLAAFKAICADLAAREGVKLEGEPYTAWTMERHGRANVRVHVKKMAEANGPDTLYQKFDAGYTIMQEASGRIFRRMALPQGLHESELHNGVWCWHYTDPKNSKTKGTETGWKPIKEYAKWTQR